MHHRIFVSSDDEVEKNRVSYSIANYTPLNDFAGKAVNIALEWINVVAASDFDPDYGTDTRHPNGLLLCIKNIRVGNQATSWRTPYTGSILALLPGYAGTGYCTPLNILRIRELQLIGYESPLAQVAVSFSYNLGAPTQQSGDNTNFMGAYLYYDNQLEEILPDTRDPVDQWLTFNTVSSISPATEVRLVFKITQGNHVPDTGIDDVVLVGTDGTRTTFYFNTPGDWLGWKMQNAGVGGSFDVASLVDPVVPFLLTLSDGINGEDTMVSDPGTYFIRFDGSFGGGTGRVWYFASPPIIM